MKIIADAGATKIDWVVIHDDKVSDPMETPGFNPYFMDQSILTDAMSKDLVPFISPEVIDNVYYYGAGCSTAQKCAIVDDVLKEVFPHADIDIHHDLVGAARSLFGDQEGIACILGTGSNSCLYNGSEITENVASLGFLFADEGSGAYLGKLWLTAYLREKLPEHLKKSFEKQYNYTLEQILDTVYNKPHPNQFLASFSKFISGIKEDKYVNDLVKRNFRDFFTEQVTRYTGFKKKKIGAVGSVGYYFSDIFKEVAGEFGLNVSINIQSPIEGLVKYHRNK
jgi:N-acetylglucosamine kinase-like BadF-type ATPase